VQSVANVMGVVAYCRDVPVPFVPSFRQKYDDIEAMLGVFNFLCVG